MRYTNSGPIFIHLIQRNGDIAVCCSPSTPSLSHVRRVGVPGIDLQLMKFLEALCM